MFQDVSDSGGNPESVFTRDEMLDDIVLYWLTNAGASSARLYREGQSSMSGLPPAPMRTPTAISMFPKELVPPPGGVPGARAARQSGRHARVPAGDGWTLFEIDYVDAVALTKACTGSSVSRRPTDHDALPAMLHGR